MKLSSTARRTRTLKLMRSRYDLYLLLLVPIAWYLVFRYYPMYGLQLAFKDFVASLGITGSPWVGLKHFRRFLGSYYFLNVLFNTVTISLYTLALGFPMPIFLALLINEIRNRRFQKLLQNITYVPHFLSLVVVVGMLNIFLHPDTGILNNLIGFFGGERTDFMTKAEWFRTVYVLSNVWQHMGWNSIIYLAALAGIDPSLYEAATIDGATRLQKITAISLPCLLPTILILLIINVGSILDVGFEKILLMQNPVNSVSSEVISTLVYKDGIQKGQYSYSTAIGMFNSVINFFILLTVNKVSKLRTGISLW